MNGKLIFSDKADNYKAGRAGYAPAAIAWIVENCLKEGGNIADVGSGTGLLSAEFISRGYETYCVEPNAEMRAHADAAFAGSPNYHSIPTAAEATTLPEKSIRLITAGSSFHWFDTAGFLAECRRILMPDGIVCLLFNARDYSDPLTLEQHEIFVRYGVNFTSLARGVEKIDQEAVNFFAPGYRRMEFDHPLTYTEQTFVSRNLSSSYAPRKGTAEYEACSEELRKLARRAARDGLIRTGNKTVLVAGSV